MFDSLRRSFAGFRARFSEPGGAPVRRGHNLFETAALYVAACAENDQEAMEEAASWVSEEALSFGVRELACRSVTVLARERGEQPRAVARALLDLPGI